MFKRLCLTQPPTTKKLLELVIDGFVGRFMQRLGWAAVTLPMPFITVILYWLTAAPLLRVHEAVHVEQREALGLFGFWYSYLRGALKGYASNPMELAAYAVEDEAETSGLPDWAK